MRLHSFKPSATADMDLEMPPKEKLSNQEIADLEKWVRIGGPLGGRAGFGDDCKMTPGVMVDPSNSTESLNREIDIEAGKEFWSFKAPVRHVAPTPNNEQWARSDIDRFLLVAMEAQGLGPVGDADDRTWLRRVTFDLIGLPPTLAEIESYTSDKQVGRDARGRGSSSRIRRLCGTLGTTLAGCGTLR